MSFGEVTEGIVDLRDLPQDFESVTLDGEWEFYWQKLLTPGISIHQDSIKYQNLPGMWNGLDLPNMQDGPGVGMATYRLTVLLDPKKEFSIYTPAVYNAYAFYINGNLIAKNGKVGNSRETSNAFWTQIVTPIEHAYLKDTNEFLLQVSNFSHFNGGPVDSIILGDRDFITNKTDVIRIVDAIISGALMMAGLFFLGLFFFGKDQKVILYFALYCMFFSYYNFASGSYLLQHLFPNLPWVISVRFEYGALYVSAILFAVFTENIYPIDTPKKILRVAYGALALQMLFLIVTPIWFFTMLHYYWMMFILFVIAIGIYIYFKAVYKKRVGSVYSLIGALFILFVLAWRILDVLGVVQMPFMLLPIGYVVFFSLHSLTLSQQFATKWRKAKESAEIALKIKSEFLSAMSHEIRTPMNAVIGLTNYLLEDDPKNNQIQNLNTLKFSAENLLVIINDILDFSKLEANKVGLDYQWTQIRELTEVLKKSIEPIAVNKNLLLETLIEDQVPISIKCDVTRTSQVLTNLLNNAIKFTKKGAVTLAISVVSVNDGNTLLRFEVRDTGIGIPSDKIEEIFESFTQVSSSTTREYGGTGLGLAISSRLLEIQNVRLQVKSEVGKGSVFYFEQNFEAKSEDTPSMLPKVFSTGNESLKGVSILLVEDNQVNVLVANRFLSKWGAELTFAENGEEGLEKAANETFDIILMDLQMPIMDGYEATRAIRAAGIETPIIALTASALLNKNDKIKKSGIDDSITKPFDPEELFDMISKYTDGAIDLE